VSPPSPHRACIPLTAVLLEYRAQFASLFRLASRQHHGALAGAIELYVQRPPHLGSSNHYTHN